MGAVRYFDGETWWYQPAQLIEELDELTDSKLSRWRKIRVGDVQLVRSLRMGGRCLVALVDVLYVLENRDRLFAAGVRLVPEEEAAKKREYIRLCQDASLAFATRRGDEYTVAELREIAESARTQFEEAIYQERTFFGIRYAKKRAKEG